MPKALSQFRPGMMVELTCYQETCTGVTMQATLRREDGQPHFSFGALLGVGRIRWRPESTMLIFLLLRNVQCPKCNRLYQTAILVSNGRGKRPTIFGYESEPA